MPSEKPEQLFDRAEKAFAAGRNAEAAPLYRQLLTQKFLPGVQLYRLATIANREQDFDAAWELRGGFGGARLPAVSALQRLHRSTLRTELASGMKARLQRHR